jgi:DNA-binding NarL/FixJ family response regulator
MKEDTRNTILIVDDDPTFPEMVKKAVGELYRVNSANSGERALAMISLGFIPDIILLDIMMPRKNGYETLKKIKQIPEVQDVPVIFLTRLTGAKNELKGLEMGAADYITKPFIREILLARLKIHLKNSLDLRYFRKILLGGRGGKKKVEPFPPLTPWELKIALLAQRRFTVYEIAAEMGITENTVKSALKNIYGKLNIHSKLQLADLDLGPGSAERRP